MRVYIFEKYETDENIRLEFKNITKLGEQNGLTYNECLVEQEKFVREHGEEVTSLDVIKRYSDIDDARKVKNIFCYGTSKNIIDNMVRGVFGCTTNNYGPLSYLTMYRHRPDEINSEDSEAIYEYSIMKDDTENMRYFIEELWSEIATGNIAVSSEKYLKDNEL